ncbi:exopolysaccharide biosynthesis protein VpsJ [soil metagenome]
MTFEREKIYGQLYSYCEAREFAGFDPFDGLNSRVFKASPLKHIALARLVWLQLLKRSPVELRPTLLVEPEVNPKGLALFALAELSRFRATGDKFHAVNAKSLLDRLQQKKIAGTTNSGQPTASFGYNFDWQSRSFYAPEGTPAIVPTAFASKAFIEAYELLGDESYLGVADDICMFILNDLNRSQESDDEVCFSYTPTDRSVIYNANLLAGESLARMGAINGNGEYLDLAAKTVRFVVRRQRSNGSWVYGANDKQAWVDNFHTAYVLLSLFRISSNIEELRSETFEAIGRGSAYWLDNFFLEDGTPKYYDQETYPIDIHSAAVAISALSELSAIDVRMLPMARKTAQWTVENMRDPEGFFFYQKRKNRTIKTPFMRWGQAWMAFALARLIESDI